MVAKAVRTTTCLRAASSLIDLGFVTEASVLMRVASDFASEMVAVAEGELAQAPTKAQQDFTRQFFERPLAGSVPAKVRYVSRDELLKSHLRLAESVGIDRQKYLDSSRAVDFALDGYVHGSYSSAMELYHGGKHAFMMDGHESEDYQRDCWTSLALALHDALFAFAFMATAIGDAALKDDIVKSMERLNRSGENLMLE